MYIYIYTYIYVYIYVCTHYIAIYLSWPGPRSRSCLRGTSVVQSEATPRRLNPRKLRVGGSLGGEFVVLVRFGVGEQGRLSPLAIDCLFGTNYRPRVHGPNAFAALLLAFQMSEDCQNAPARSDMCLTLSCSNSAKQIRGGSQRYSTNLGSTVEMSECYMPVRTTCFPPRLLPDHILRICKLKKYESRCLGNSL